MFNRLVVRELHLVCAQAVPDEATSEAEIAQPTGPSISAIL